MMLVITPSSLCTMVSVAGTTVTARYAFFFTLTMQSVMVCWSISGLTPS